MKLKAAPLWTIFLIASSASAYAETAKPASAFVDSIGVNTHLTQQKAYYDGSKVKAALQYLGIKHLRDAAPDPRKPYPDVYSDYARSGFDFSLFGSGYGTASQAIAQAAAFQASHPQALIALEGYNEPNNWKRPTVGWYARSADTHAASALYVRELKTAGTVAFGVAGLPILNASDEPPPGAIGDAVNVHTYGRFSKSQSDPKIGYPQPTLWYDLRRYRAAAPGLRTWVTETGYYTTRGTDGVDERVQASYLLQTLLYNFQHDVVRTYLYELMDESTLLDTEYHYGLFRNDHSPKPVAMQIHNLASLLAEDQGSRPSSPDGDLRVAFGDPKVKQVTLRRKDGSYVVLFWKELNLWSGQLQQPVDAPASSISWTLTSPALVYAFDLQSGVRRRLGLGVVHGSVDYDSGVGALTIQVASSEKMTSSPVAETRP